MSDAIPPATSTPGSPNPVLIGVDWGGTKIEAAALAPDGAELEAPAPLAPEPGGEVVVELVRHPLREQDRHGRVRVDPARG